MNINIKLRPGGLLLAMLLTAGFSTAVSAAETAVGTTISNTASVAYDVASVAQTPKTGSTSFTVDRKINLTLVDANAAYNSAQTSSPAPGSSNAVLKYTLTNTGNGTQDFNVSAGDTSDPYGGSDNYDQAASVFVDVNANGTYEPLTDTATFVDELAQNASISVFIVGNIGAARADGDISAKTLTAVAEVGGTATVEGAAEVETAGADTATALTPGTDDDVVFADSTGDGGDVARDGMVSRKDAFKVISAQITVTKSSSVISDPFNLLVNPKRIPGATVRYTITVTNSATAGAAATAVTLSDTVDANTSYVSPSITVDGGATGTDANDGVDASGFDVRQSAGVVTVVIGAMAANSTHTITFDVTVN